MRLNSDHRRRSFWLKHLHRWHWISAALCLVGMILFAITGITLNHAGEIEASPRTAVVEKRLPAALLAAAAGAEGPERQPLPPALADWLEAELKVRAAGRAAEWSADEIYLALPRPGGDGWVTIDRGDGQVRHEITDRGWISYLNDLHKGRNAGPAWTWFLDLFAAACLVFALTGLALLKLHAGGRPATWPTVGFGLVAPMLIVLLFIH
ncbi:PepSY-associated TM helix domain-containing protein [Stella sp.]|uniref:PepSY-associated TM helix domain-containing protein n=1 Tax=Stella sp. TaxID=2912054 RepID=UPI0035AEA60D